VTGSRCHHRPVRVSLASIVCEKGDVEGNLARHVTVLDRARTEGCAIAVFPELSLTGSVDPLRHPERAVALDHEGVRRLTEATDRSGVAALFGIGERQADRFYITQVLACGGRIVGWQRKRHLGEDEEGFAVGHESSVFDVARLRFAVVICAESGVAFTWDAAAGAGARVAFLCSAPGLHGRRASSAAWRDGFEWWEGAGLDDARRHARRCRLWVGMATQAGSTVDEDFPGISALVSPAGDVVDRLPDWAPGTLVVDLPIAPTPGPRSPASPPPGRGTRPRPR
jgi:predicted amidohydrolase